jgi:hypothetical protein
VLRWLATFVTAPGTRDAREAGARVLAAGLPAAVRTTAFAAPAS